ncbi:MAG: hypothetical protein ACRDI1_01365 [Actinomycetota bacterium]
MILLALLIVAAAGLAVWIALPLFGPAAARPKDVWSEDLVEMKHAVYRSILDLEFDRRVGKVSEDDYRLLRGQHESEAIDLLHRLDREADREEITDALEAEISAARERLRRE